MRRVDRLIANGGITAFLYNNVCSTTKAFLKPNNLIGATFTQAAVDELLSSDRIFSDYNGQRASRMNAKPIPKPCALTLRTLGTTTLAEARGRPALLAKTKHYAGNWVLMRRQGIPSGDARAYVTVCGFYDCKRSASSRMERLVKHMNLCRYAVEKDEGLRYLTSGSFVVGCEGLADRRPEVIVNARSGSWAMAKVFLRASGTLTESDLEKIDNQVVRLAESRVRRVVLDAVLRPSGPRRTSQS